MTRKIAKKKKVKNTNPEQYGLESRRGLLLNNDLEYVQNDRNEHLKEPVWYTRTQSCTQHFGGKYNGPYTHFSIDTKRPLHFGPN